MTFQIPRGSPRVAFAAIRYFSELLRLQSFVVIIVSSNSFAHVSTIITRNRHSRWRCPSKNVKFIDCDFGSRKTKQQRRRLPPTIRKKSKCQRAEKKNTQSHYYESAVHTLFSGHRTLFLDTWNLESGISQECASSSPVAQLLTKFFTTSG
jgi:hypothetical protein